MNRGELEARRLAAVRDIKLGIPGGVMVERYKISRTTLTRWRRAVKDGRSLKATVCKGRPRRLDAGKESILKRLWFLGPQLLIGTDTDHWTNGRFAKAVGQHMGIRYSRDHMGRIMHRLGLTPKRENRRAGWALQFAVPGAGFGLSDPAKQIGGGGVFSRAGSSRETRPPLL